MHFKNLMNLMQVVKFLIDALIRDMINILVSFTSLLAVALFIDWLLRPQADESTEGPEENAHH